MHCYAVVGKIIYIRKLTTAWPQLVCFYCAFKSFWSLWFCCV